MKHIAAALLIACSLHATSTSWNQNEMAGPVLVLCAGVGVLTIPLNVSARNKEAKRKRLAAL